ncbi:MAG: hypothetical protein ACRESZ_02950 [Methylococcales bacterium]
MKLDTEGEILAAVESKTIPDKKTIPNHFVITKDISIFGNSHASVIIRFQVVRAFEGGSSFILTPLQALGFDLKVEAPKEVDVLASAYVPETLTNGVEHLPDNGNYHWVLKKPLLPYQGVYLTWKSKPQTHAGQVAIAVGD